MKTRTEALTEIILDSEEYAKAISSLEECLYYVGLYESEHYSNKALDILYRAHDLVKAHKSFIAGQKE